MFQRRLMISSCFFAFVILVLISFSLPEPVFASGYWSGALLGDDGQSYDLSEFGSAVQTVYTIAKFIMLPLGSVAVAFGAVRMFTGSEGEAGKAKRQIIFGLLAVVAILLLPTVAKMGVDIGKQYAWEPTTKATDGFETKYVGNSNLSHDSSDDSDDDNKDDEKDKDEEKDDE